MQPTIYEIERIGSGWLAMMGRSAGDWASDELAGLSALDVTDVVSLLEAAEAREVGLAAEARYCEAAGIRFHSYPIRDRGVRSSEHHSEGIAAVMDRIVGWCRPESRLFDTELKT